MDQLGSHGLFDLTVEAEGDLWIDDHHTTEDIALALGQALAQALGDRKGIHRFGEFSAPLDEVHPRFPGNRPPGRVPSHGSRLLPNSATDPRAPRTQALTHVVLDLSGRPSFNSNLAIPAERIGTFQTEMVEHFFESLANTSGMTLHIRQLAGKNSHHIVECTFKAFARALRKATEEDPRRAGSIASSKGVLTQQ